MGLTVLEIEVGNPADPKVRERLEFLIDSGAIYSVVPSAILDRLNIKPLPMILAALSARPTVPARTNLRSASATACR